VTATEPLKTMDCGSRFHSNIVRGKTIIVFVGS